MKWKLLKRRRTKNYRKNSCVCNSNIDYHPVLHHLTIQSNLFQHQIEPNDDNIHLCIINLKNKNQILDNLLRSCSTTTFDIRFPSSSNLTAPETPKKSVFFISSILKRKHNIKYDSFLVSLHDFLHIHISITPFF